MCVGGGAVYTKEMSLQCWAFRGDTKNQKLKVLSTPSGDKSTCIYMYNWDKLLAICKPCQTFKWNNCLLLHSVHFLFQNILVKYEELL